MLRVLNKIFCSFISFQVVRVVLDSNNQAWHKENVKQEGKYFQLMRNTFWLVEIEAKSILQPIHFAVRKKVERLMIWHFLSSTITRSFGNINFKFKNWFRWVVYTLELNGTKNRARIRYNLASLSRIGEFWNVTSLFYTHLFLVRWYSCIIIMMMPASHLGFLSQNDD